MNFAEIFIRRPVLASVISLLILLLGLEGAMQLTVREYPKVNESVITVTTAYPGANSELIQGFITTPISKAVSSVEDTDYVTSSSAQSSSTVTVHMRLGADPDKALTETISKVQAVKRRLPQDAEDPIVQKGTGFTQPLMFLSLTSAVMSSQQMGEYVARVVQPRMATVQGVAEARIVGATDFAMRIWLDPLRLAAHNVTASEVSAAIRNANYLAAPGSLKNEYYTFQVQTNTTLRTPEEFGALPIRGSGDSIVRLRDVATVELGAQNYTDSVTSTQGAKADLNKETIVIIAIYPTPTANPLDVGKGVQAIFPSVVRNLPPGLTGRINYDSSLQISAAIHDVFVTMGEAVAIVVVVIFIFLGSLRSVIIPAVTIPLSLVGVCFVLFALGYSINLLTLLAMVLAIGLVVDDAIVVVENVYRHIELGEHPKRAAILGMQEILGPIVAMTMTLAAVYAPVGFVQGLTGALFREFAFALAGAVIISGIIAVTLSPMLSALLLKPHAPAHSRGEPFAKKVDRAFSALAGRYRGLLTMTLSARGIVLVICAMVLATTWVMFTKTSKELAPTEDRGFLPVFIQGPEYGTVNYTQNVVRRFNSIVGDMPEAQTQFTIIGGGLATPNAAFRGYVLKPWGERDRTIREIKKDLDTKLKNLPGAQAYPMLNSGLPGVGQGLPVQFVVRGVGSPAQVYEVAEKIKAKALESRKFVFMIDSANFDAPRSTVDVDRDKAAALGVPVSDVGTTLSTLVGENWVSRFDQDNRSYEVIPQVREQDRSDPSVLDRYYVRSAEGSMVPLSALTKVSTSGAPASIEQFNQLNSATLQGMGLGLTVSEGLKVLGDIARDVMPDGFFIDYIGEGRLASQEGSSLAVTFIFAVLIIYLVLAAQFESFRDPLIILIAVPFSIFGAMVPLNLLGPLGSNGATLNIYSELGLITLVGLIAKHGILIVRFANDRRAEGVDMHDAILEAAHVRLRPILMTTAAMVLGVFPLLVASGAGAGARFSIGLVIFSGMAIGTVFTLFVVPVFYTFIAHKDAPLAAAPRIRPQAEETPSPKARAAE